jgi:hypothetical protein
MQPESSYEAWKRCRSAGAVPAGFTDRVMVAVSGAATGRAPSALERWLAGLLASRAGKLGVCALGCLACAFRIFSLVALFFPR